MPHSAHTYKATHTNVCCGAYVRGWLLASLRSVRQPYNARKHPNITVCVSVFERRLGVSWQLHVSGFPCCFLSYFVVVYCRFCCCMEHTLTHLHLFYGQCPCHCFATADLGLCEGWRYPGRGQSGLVPLQLRRVAAVTCSLYIFIYLFECMCMCVLRARQL